MPEPLFKADDFCDYKSQKHRLFIFYPIRSRKCLRISKNIMLLSLALVFLCGLSLGGIFKKLRLPSLLGMLITGILLGPYVLNLLSPRLLDLSTELRQIALIIILMRAGLSLDVRELKKIGRPALLMCFIPASLEIVGFVFLAPPLLGLSVTEAALMGTVIAAVSPAVIVPRMLHLMEEGYGKEKGIPQLIMAGASVDDVFVIVLFTALSSLAQGGRVQATDFIRIPTSIITGLLVGVAAGLLLCLLFKKFHIRDTGKVIIIVSVSLLFVSAEHALTGVVGFSGLLAVMALGGAMNRKNGKLAVRLSAKYSKLWVGAEVMLFVLVGAAVDIRYALSAGLAAVLVVLGALVFRILGVYLCLLGTKLNLKERLFCMIAYAPKATVQAAIGSIPLSLGLPSGGVILTVAVVSIIITAPAGALAIDATYKKLLSKDSWGSKDVSAPGAALAAP